MARDASYARLGRIGREVFRLGLSATYRPGRPAVVAAIDHGVNYFFAFGIDTQLIRTLRDACRTRRDDFVIATGGYNWILWRSNLRKLLEKRLRELGTDHLDVFMFLGVMKPEQFPERVREEMLRFRDEGKVRAIGISTHDRRFAGELARTGAVDLLMIRYNAAHRGAETEIFPHTHAHDPAIVSYTATRWTYLVRRVGGWPKNRPVPTADLAYRFVLSHPDVDVVLTAPRSTRELLQNVESVKRGPLAEDEMRFMREYGDWVHEHGGWFM